MIWNLKIWIKTEFFYIFESYIFIAGLIGIAGKLYIIENNPLQGSINTMQLIYRKKVLYSRLEYCITPIFFSINLIGRGKLLL